MGVPLLQRGQVEVAFFSTAVPVLRELYPDMVRCPTSYGVVQEGQDLLAPFPPRMPS